MFIALDDVIIHPSIVYYAETAHNIKEHTRRQAVARICRQYCQKL